MTKSVTVIGAREASIDLRARARGIETGLPVLVRRTADHAVGHAQDGATETLGHASGDGERSGRLHDAIQRSRVISLKTADGGYYTARVAIKHVYTRSAYYGRKADPGDYGYFVEHGTSAKIATGHAGGVDKPSRRPPGYSKMSDYEKRIADLERTTFAHRGNLMIFRESRQGGNRNHWWFGHFFRGQTGKHFMERSAYETSHSDVPVLLRTAGLL